MMQVIIIYYIIGLKSKKYGTPISENIIKNFNSISSQHNYIDYYFEIKNLFIKNNLKYYNGEVYKLKTKCTYEYLMDIEEFINNLNLNTKEICIKNIKCILLLILVAKKFVEYIKSNIGYKFLPNYKINFNFIEFNDCIYNIDNGEVLTINPDIICFKYFNKNLENIKKPKAWLEILENSYEKSTIKLFCKWFGKLFRKHEPRDKRIFLSGPSESGKTSLLLVLKEFYGKNLIGLISQQNDFNLSNVINSKVIIGEEFNSISITREQFLIMCEGGDLLVSRKHKNDTLVTFNMGIIWLSNKPLDYDDYNSGAINSRIINFELNKLEKINRNKRKEIIDETAEVLIYCNEIYLNN